MSRKVSRLHRHDRRAEPGVAAHAALKRAAPVRQLQDFPEHVDPGMSTGLGSRFGDGGDHGDGLRLRRCNGDEIADRDTVA